MGGRRVVSTSGFVFPVGKKINHLTSRGNFLKSYFRSGKHYKFKIFSKIVKKIISPNVAINVAQNELSFIRERGVSNLYLWQEPYGDHD